MTLSVSTRSGSFVADGLATPRILPFRLFDNADLIVTANGVAQTLNVHYQLTGTYPAQRMIPIAPFWANNVVVRYKRITPPRQLYDMVSGAPMQSETLESELDRNAMVALDVTGEQVDVTVRALRVPEGEIAAPLPSASQIKGKFLAQDLDGNWYGSTGIGADAGLRADIAGANGTALIKHRPVTAPVGSGISVGETLDRISLMPESYYLATDPDMTAAVQRCIDAAGNWPAAATIRKVKLSQMYAISQTIEKRPYVSIIGDGEGRTGFIPAASMIAGPVMECGSADNDDGLYLDILSDFRIDGINIPAGSSTYAMGIKGQEVGTLARVGFWRFNTNEAALQMTSSCEGLLIEKCFFFDNKKHEKIASDVTSFPTTISHKNCRYDGGLAGVGSAIDVINVGEAKWDDCTFQGNSQKYLFDFVANTDWLNTQKHLLISNYFENNGGQQAGSRVIRMTGVPTNRIDRFDMIANSFHGFNSDNVTGVIEGTYVDDFTSFMDSNAPSEKYWKNGGNNRRINIDQRTVGAVEGPVINTNGLLSRFMIDAAGNVLEPEGEIPVVTKQGAGYYWLVYPTNFTTLNIKVLANGCDGNGDPLAAGGFVEPATMTRFNLRSMRSAVATDPYRLTIEVYGKLT